MSDIYTEIQEVICKIPGIDPDKTAEIVNGLARQFGGRELYFPTARLRQSRDSKIAMLYNGANMRKVCYQFRVSKATVYRATKKTSSFRVK